MDQTETATGSGPMAAIQPPVAYLPCRLDERGGVTEVMMAELEDGRIALMATRTARPAAAAQVRLDPEGVTVPAGLGSSRHLSWRDVDRVEGRPAWQPLLVVLPRKGEAIAIRLLPQAWSPTAIADVVDHYADHAGPRRELVRSASVERFRNR